MSVQVSKFPDMNALILRYVNPFDPVGDVLEANRKIAEYWTADDILYTVFDLTQVNFTFSDIVQLLASASQKPDNSTGYYPGIENVIIVMFGEQELVRELQAWAHQEQYNNIESMLYGSEAEAVAYVRELVSKEPA